MTSDRRPSFAQDFPRTPELDAAVDAFARGDYAQVRAAADAIDRGDHGDAVKLAARRLVDRTRPDPLALALLALAAALLAVVGGWWIVHGHAGQ